MWDNPYRKPPRQIVDCDADWQRKVANASATLIGRASAVSVPKLTRLLDVAAEQLNPRQRQVARLRIDHPNLSYRELAKLAEPPMRPESIRSCVQHLCKLADQVAPEPTSP